MSTSIVRQPIIGPEGEAVAYELLYEDKGISLYNQQDMMSANMIADFLLHMDTSKFLDEKKAFITFTPSLLEKDIPQMMSPNHLVIQVDDTVLVHPVAQELLESYHRQGFQIAIKGFEFSSRYFAILDIVDIIKLDLSRPNHSLSSILDIGNSFQKTVMAENVNTKAVFDLAEQYGIRYLQGTTVAESMYSAVPKMEHLQSNFFQLIVAVTKEEADVDEITDVISRDVTITFSLIKLVNSAYFALRNPVRSVKQALVVLGIDQLKQWIYLLSFKGSDGKIPVELIKTSFLRGRFCQEVVASMPEFSISPSEAYLMGMFSTLGLLMGLPLEEVVAKLPISDEMKQGIVEGEGPCGDLYNLTIAFDLADFKHITPYMEALGLERDVVNEKYVEAAEYVNGIWNSLMSPQQQA